MKNYRSRTEYAKEMCDNLAARSKLYKYTLYPLDCLIAKFSMWIFK
jgi:hypothetical protein